MAKETRIALRASEEMKTRLAAVAKRVGLSETTLTLACVEALIEYIEEHGEIRLPLAIIPKSELKKNPSRMEASRSTAEQSAAHFNEDPPRHRGGLKHSSSRSQQR